MKRFLAEYSAPDGDYGFDIYADSLEDADRRLLALKSNARIEGRHIATIAVGVPKWTYGMVFLAGIALGMFAL